MGLLLFNSLQEGLGYAILALGVYITFRILNMPDLTVDGSFGLGMAVSIVLTVAGHPFLALVIACIAGAAAGCFTGLLQTKVRIHPILAGILTMNGLYTVNLIITGGKSNVSSAVAVSLFNLLQDATGLSRDLCKIIIPFILCVIVVAVLAVFFKTRKGLAIRATGDNEDMVRSSSINADAYKCAGLAIGNACVALSGAVIGQSMSFFDVGYGSGMVVVGLASVIIGETIMGKHGVTVGLTSAVVGSCLYRMFIAAALKVGLFPAYSLKLISAVIVIIALAIPTIQKKIGGHRRKGGASKC